METKQCPVWAGFAEPQRVSTVWKIQVQKLMPDLKWESVLVVRVGAPNQGEAEKVAATCLTEWLRQHPGIPASYVVGTCPPHC